MDVDALWTNILGEIELEVSHGHYSSFFRNTRLSLSPKDNAATILCPHGVAANMLQTRFSGLIRNHLEQKLQAPVKLGFKIASPVVQAETNTNKDVGPLFTSIASFESVLRQGGLKPDYTFDNFAVSETNHMAYAACKAVAAKPGASYNPLFLWGPTGVGKTHLMQATGRQVLVKKHDIKLIYCTAEEFTNEIIEAIRTRSTSAFKRKYRTVSLFMIDDIQFIAGRETVQMEFFHTFNSVIQAGGQVILTSDKPPSNIDKLEARLRSRFEGGLSIDISSPNFELRTAILITKARERGVTLPTNIVHQMAAAVEDVRALEGLLLRFISEQEHEYDMDKIISRLLKNPVQTDRKKVSPHKIIDVVAGFFDVKLSQLAGTSRKKQIVGPRHLLMFMLRQELGMPYNEIGALLGGRDHTTILHGFEKISHLLPKQEKLRATISQIRNLLGE